MSETIHEPARETPVICGCDVLVAGGSTTGVFAALAAARLGQSVALLEQLGYFGGTATASLVCIWHSDRDTSQRQQIIGGLLSECLERLRQRDALDESTVNESRHYVFQPAELILVLDQMVAEEPLIRPFLHARLAELAFEDGQVTAAIIEDKSGRRAIRAKAYIDATGDADLVYRAGLPVQRDSQLQPPTTTCVVAGSHHLPAGFQWSRTVFDPKYPEALPPGFLWSAGLPGTDLLMISGTRVHGADCSDAEQLTAAEMIGREQVANMLDLLRRHIPGGDQVKLVALPARIGVRQTRQIVGLHRLSETEVLEGHRFDDAIANGSYRVDVHHADGDGLTFRYLDGREVVVTTRNGSQAGRWRDPREVDPTYYQIPYRSLVPLGSRNVLAAGRCLDADRGAFGAVRVMVNAAQTGQAAGVAAAYALRTGCGVAEVPAEGLRAALARQGAVII